MKGYWYREKQTTSVIRNGAYWTGDLGYLDEAVSPRQAWTSPVAWQTVGIVVVETDKYDRLVGTVYLDNRNIKLAMVEGGHAWWYRYYARHERPLEAAEREARKQKRGLWADPATIPPWDWRRRRRRN